MQPPPAPLSVIYSEPDGGIELEEPSPGTAPEGSVRRYPSRHSRSYASFQWHPVPPSRPRRTSTYSLQSKLMILVFVILAEILTNSGRIYPRPSFVSPPTPSGPPHDSNDFRDYDTTHSASHHGHRGPAYSTYSSDVPYQSRPPSRSSTRNHQPYLAIDPYRWRRPQHTTDVESAVHETPATPLPEVRYDPRDNSFEVINHTTPTQPATIVVPPATVLPPDGSPGHPVVVTMPVPQDPAPYILPTQPQPTTIPNGHTIVRVDSLVTPSFPSLSVSALSSSVSEVSAPDHDAMEHPYVVAFQHKPNNPNGSPRVLNTIVSITPYLFSVIPCQLYLHILLRMPSLYFSRVTRVFEDADLSMPDIKEMLFTAGDDIYQLNWYGPQHRAMSPSVARFKLSWDDFVTSLMSEWQNQNILSALLLGAVLTMLQIEGIEGDPVSRTGALLSLVCALMSLLYGCIYMSRFGSMNKLYKAASWAEEARNTRTSIIWNVWVFLAMPAIWLAWSIIFFSASALCYIWRRGSTNDPEDVVRLSPPDDLGPRIAVTGVFCLGLVYFGLIMNTLRRYGSTMDKAWKARAISLRNRIDEKGHYSGSSLPGQTPPHSPYFPQSPFFPQPSLPSSRSTQQPVFPNIPPTVQSDLERDHVLNWLQSANPAEPPSLPRGSYEMAADSPTSRPNAFDQPIVVSRHGRRRLDTAINIVEFMTSGDKNEYPHHEFLNDHQFNDEAWLEFTQHAARIQAETTQDESEKELLFQDFINTWNSCFFEPRDLLVTAQWSQLASPSEPHVLVTLSVSSPPPPDPTTTPLIPVTPSSPRPSDPNPPMAGPSTHIPSFDDSESSNHSVNENTGDPVSHETSQIQDILSYQDAPGPYLKALEVHRAFPDCFYRRLSRWETANEKVISHLRQAGAKVDNVAEVLDISEIYREPWERLTTDLRLVLAGKFPIPGLSENDCLAMRRLIAADVVATWNQRYFLKRSIEIVLDPADLDIARDSQIEEAATPEVNKINSRGYPPVPHTLMLNVDFYGAVAIAEGSHPSLDEDKLAGDQNMASTPRSRIYDNDNYRFALNEFVGNGVAGPSGVDRDLDIAGTSVGSGVAGPSEMAGDHGVTGVNTSTQASD
ncbi:hypothetical protein HGRIS_003920 [Hohenbuehelia grisea]|uniref:Uncharacterized protein n=1 Tax=Hohenbuehelia grisea TaxID=104357 RepID=A0ABR3JGY0_9AGAR